MRAREGIEGFFRAGERTTQGLAGPERFVEQFLDVMLRLVQIHREFFLDHIPAQHRGLLQGVQQCQADVVVADDGLIVGILENVETSSDSKYTVDDVKNRVTKQVQAIYGCPGVRVP